MKIFVKGIGAVTLGDTHFRAMGGQASVYVKDSVAYKIYKDPASMIPDAKFMALASINDPQVIKPERPILDKTDKPVGYTMRAVADNCSLSELFTKDFRLRHNVTNDHIVGLTAKLKDHVTNVHKAGVLVVDLNEFNVLVPMTFDDTFLIDVDSYQTKGYPATVILPSVRDYSVSSKDFSELSDWFSFGILAFQLFIGAHPYKGGHDPTTQKFTEKPKRLEHRMRNHISAFRSDVRLPTVCNSFDVIPQNFREWLVAVLDKGKRLPPPDPRGGPAAVIVTHVAPVVVSGDKVVIVEFLSFDGQLVSYAESGSNTLALVQKGATVSALLNGRVIHSWPAMPGQIMAGFTPKMAKPVALHLYQGKLTVLDLTKKHEEAFGMRADELSKSGDRFYIRNQGEILEIQFVEIGKNLVATSNPIADVMPNASRLYEGVAVQSIFGAVYVSLFDASNSSRQVKIPELDAYKILDAKFEGGVLMVLGAQDGRYNRLIFRFSPDFYSYDLRVIEDITPSGLNFVTLSSGVCVSLTEDEKVEGFSVKKDSQGVKVVEDTVLGGMHLLKVGGKVGFERAGKLYQMSLK